MCVPDVPVGAGLRAAGLCLRGVAAALAVATMIWLPATAVASPSTVAHASKASQTTLDAVSCPSVSLCVAVGSDGINNNGGGLVSTTTNPAGGAWSSATPAIVTMLSVSCPSISLCVAVGGDEVATSTDPSGGAGAWTPAAVPDAFNGLTAVSCPSVSLCVALDENGDVLTSIDPTGGTGAWTKTTERIGASDDALSCPLSSLCVAGDDFGGLYASTDPTGGSGAWTASTQNLPLSTLFGISCTASSLCVAVDNSGELAATTDPTGGSTAWDAAHIDNNVGVAGPEGFTGVSCTASSLCVATDAAGNVWSSTDPTGGVGAWNAATIDPVASDSLSGVACPSSALCVAVDYSGNVFSTTDPTGGAGAWSSTVPVATPVAPSSTSAPTVSNSVAGGVVVGGRLTATDGGWSGTNPISFAFQWQACASTCTNIAEATSETLTPTAADVGKRLRVVVTATNSAGSTEAASSQVGPVNVPPGAVTAQLSNMLAGAAKPANVNQLVNHGAVVLAVGGVKVGWASTGYWLVTFNPPLRAEPCYVGIYPVLTPPACSPSANVASAAKSKETLVLIASGKVKFSKPGKERLTLRLTSAGRRLLREHRRFKVATVGTFTPTNAAAIRVTSHLTL